MVDSTDRPTVLCASRSDAAEISATKFNVNSTTNTNNNNDHRVLDDYDNNNNDNNDEYSVDVIGVDFSPLVAYIFRFRRQLVIRDFVFACRVCDCVQHATSFANLKLGSVVALLNAPVGSLQVRFRVVDSHLVFDVFALCIVHTILFRCCDLFAATTSKHWSSMKMKCVRLLFFDSLLTQQNAKGRCQRYERHVYRRQHFRAFDLKSTQQKY
jgi:hypothetical protein